MDVLQELALVKMAGNRASYIQDAQYRQLAEQAATKNEISMLRAQIAQQAEESHSLAQRESRIEELRTQGRRVLCDIESELPKLRDYSGEPSSLWLELARREQCLHIANDLCHLTALDDIRFIKTLSEQINQLCELTRAQFNQQYTPLKTFIHDLPLLTNLVQTAEQIWKARLFIPLDKAKDIRDFQIKSQNDGKKYGTIMAQAVAQVSKIPNLGYINISTVTEELIASLQNLNAYNGTQEKIDVTANIIAVCPLVTKYAPDFINSLGILVKDYYNWIDKCIATFETYRPENGEHYMSSRRKELIMGFDPNDVSINDINGSFEALNYLMGSLDNELDNVAKQVPRIYIDSITQLFARSFSTLIMELKNNNTSGPPLFITDVLFDSELLMLIFKQGSYYQLIKKESQELRQYQQYYIDLCAYDRYVLGESISHANQYNYRTAKTFLEEASGKFQEIDIKQYGNRILESENRLKEASNLLHRIRSLVKDKKSSIKSFFISPKKTNEVGIEYLNIKDYCNSLPYSELRIDLAPIVEAMELELQGLKT